MRAHTEYQKIEYNGKPAFVPVPYEDGAASSPFSRPRKRGLLGFRKKWPKPMFCKTIR